ncbi:MAG: zinc-binding dehydrogenase [Hyphomicrobiales bacterium]
MATIPSHSRAAVLRSFGEPVRIEQVPVPTEIEPGAVLVKTETCSICGTDVHLWQGSLALTVDLPVILGHEMVGRVAKLGPGAEKESAGRKLREGDRIVWTHTACNSCFFCTVARQPTLCENRRAYMYENIEKPPYLLGGFSEYVYVLPQSSRFRVPDAISSPVASLCSCALRSVMNAYANLGEIQPHETVVVQGSGPLGLLATAVASVAGARRVIIAGAPDARLDLAEAFGATDIISIERTGPEERLDKVLSCTDGRGADIVMEFTGHPGAFNEGLAMARRGGRYLVVGQLGEGETTIKPSILVKKNLRLVGSFSGDARSYWQALRFAEHWQGRIPFEKMISNRFTIDEVNTALGRMKAFQEIKPVIEFA